MTTNTTSINQFIPVIEIEDLALAMKNSPAIYEALSAAATNLALKTGIDPETALNDLTKALTPSSAEKLDNTCYLPRGARRRNRGARGRLGVLTGEMGSRVSDYQSAPSMPSGSRRWRIVSYNGKGGN